MSVTVDLSPASYNIYNDPAILVNFLLEAFNNRAPVDYACVLSRAEDLKHTERITECRSKDEPDPERESAVLALMHRQLEAATSASQPQILDTAELESIGFKSGLIFPLAVPDEVLGIVGVFADSPNAYNHEIVTRALPPIALARMVLENVYMY